MEKQSPGFRELRIAAGVSQGALSKESVVNRQRLSYAECGYLNLTEEENRAVQDALRRIVERRMAKFRGVLQAM
jgi:transcriptional regulator with XRE-family HTH domain